MTDDLITMSKITLNKNCRFALNMMLHYFDILMFNWAA